MLFASFRGNPYLQPSLARAREPAQGIRRTGLRGAARGEVGGRGSALVDGAHLEERSSNQADALANSPVLGRNVSAEFGPSLFRRSSVFLYFSSVPGQPRLTRRASGPGTSFGGSDETASARRSWQTQLPLHDD